MSSSSAKVLSSSRIKAQVSDSMSFKVWGLDWEKELPRPLTDSIRVEFRTYDEALPLIAELFPEVYQYDADAKFRDRGPAEFRRRYYETSGDFFVFYDSENNDAVAGMAIGTILDWSGYNFRNIAIAPAYQESGIYLKFFEMLCEVLKEHGLERIEGDVAPSNRHHIHVLNKMGYIVTSVSMSERWGVMLHITKYLNESDEERWGELFSMTHKTDLAANRRSRKPRAKAPK